jgi:hypothetical protein
MTDIACEDAIRLGVCDACTWECVRHDLSTAYEHTVLFPALMYVQERVHNAYVQEWTDGQEYVFVHELPSL